MCTEMQTTQSGPVPLVSASCGSISTCDISSQVTSSQTSDISYIPSRSEDSEAEDQYVMAFLCFRLSLN